MSKAVQRAILTADADALEALVRADASLLHAPVDLGDGSKNTVPPLHLVCDVVFRGLITDEEALPLADVLLDAGVDPEDDYAASGDTYLIAAASLGAEQVGLRLLERKADVTRSGLFGATALHWAALMGLESLSRALVEAGSELELRDSEYECTPLEWALHAWFEGTKGRKEGLPLVAEVLLRAGAHAPETALGSLQGDQHAAMREVLLRAAEQSDG